jgi:hypothetical protein
VPKADTGVRNRKAAFAAFSPKSSHACAFSFLRRSSKPRAMDFSSQLSNFLISLSSVQRHDGLAHWLWRDMDQTSHPLLQFEDHPNRPRDRERTERQRGG